MMTTDSIRDAGEFPDVFISHASEDELEVAQPLADLLERRGVRVWHDAINIKLGDSIFERIDEGLRRSRFGVVILSRHYFVKEWTKRELRALWDREVGGRKVLIPVWHNLSRDDIREYSALLADMRAISTGDKLDAVAGEIARIVTSLDPSAAREGRAVGASPSGFSTGLQPSYVNSVKALRDRLDVVLAGQYIVETLVSTGEKSVVFRARDQALGRQVVVRVLDASKAEPEDKPLLVRSFHQAMRNAAVLKHRNIVEVLAGRKDDDLPYVVMEYVAGVRLDKILQTTGVQPFIKIRDFLLKVGDALHYAHRKGFLHLNLRPTAILIDKEGQPVVSPFRFRCGTETANCDGWRLCAEEIKYRSPEQHGFTSEQADFTGAADQYSLGLIAYEMVIGRPVIESMKEAEINRQKQEFMKSTPDPRKIRPNCPIKLAKAIMRMIKTEPGKRFPRLSDAQEALGEISLDPPASLDKATRELMRESMESYRRCRGSPSFFQDFYTAFFAVHPEFVKRFPPDQEQQYYVLRETLELMLGFPAESRDEPTTLAKVAESHRRRGIEPALFDSFMTLLIETVRKHDPLCHADSRRIVEAWTTTVKPAVDYMRQRATDPIPAPIASPCGRRPAPGPRPADHPGIECPGAGEGGAGEGEGPEKGTSLGPRRREHP